MPLRTYTAVRSTPTFVRYYRPYDTQHGVQLCRVVQAQAHPVEDRRVRPATRRLVFFNAGSLTYLAAQERKKDLRPSPGVRLGGTHKR
jgi:hypothetical protein